MSRYLKYAIIPAGFGVVTIALFSTNENYARTFKLYRNIGPVIAHYRFIEFKAKYLITEQQANIEYDKLHEKYSGIVADTLAQLRGFYIKVGLKLIQGGSGCCESTRYSS